MRAAGAKQRMGLKEEQAIQSKRRRTSMNARRRPKEAPDVSRKSFQFWYLAFGVSILILGCAYFTFRCFVRGPLILESLASFNPPDDAIPSMATLHDFASRHSGGKVLMELTTPPSKKDKRNGPTAVIDDDLNPGKCWVIDGSHGQIGIQLSEAIFITHVTIEHVAKELVDKVITAPKKLLVWGVLSSNALKKGGSRASKSRLDVPGISDPRFSFLPLASLRYEIASSSNGQTYLLRHTHLTTSFEGIIIEVLENWGGDSTCIYGIRVHGYRSIATSLV